MAKEVGNRAKKNHIKTYFEQKYKDVTIIKDLLESDEPSLKFETNNRIITLSSDKYGNVLEDYRMKKGCGSKADYIKKEKAYLEINNFKSKHYKGIDIKSESFEDSFIKIQTDDFNITISYDLKANQVIEKKRNRNKKTETKQENKVIKQENKAIKSKKENTKKENTKKEDTKKENTKNEDNSTEPLKKKRKVKFKEGDKAINIYNHTEYYVLGSKGNIVKLNDSAGNFYMMTSSDLIKV